MNSLKIIIVKKGTDPNRVLNPINAGVVEKCL